MLKIFSVVFTIVLGFFTQLVMADDFSKAIDECWESSRYEDCEDQSDISGCRKAAKKFETCAKAELKASGKNKKFLSQYKTLFKEISNIRKEMYAAPTECYELAGKKEGELLRELVSTLNKTYNIELLEHNNAIKGFKDIEDKETEKVVRKIAKNKGKDIEEELKKIRKKCLDDIQEDMDNKVEAAVTAFVKATTEK